LHALIEGLDQHLASLNELSVVTAVYLHPAKPAPVRLLRTHAGGSVGVNSNLIFGPHSYA